MNENKTEQVVETKVKKRKQISRKWRYGTASTVLTIVVIAGVVLLNIVAGLLEQRYPLNLDLTADDTFTISEKSRELAGDIEEEVEVVVFQDESYYSSPSLGNDDLNTIARQFYEAMKQLSTASDGRIRTRYINFADNPTLVAQYKDYEVAEDSILFICGDRHGVTSLVNMFNYDEQSYMYYGLLQVTESLVEQNIATNLRKVTGNLAPVVVLTGHGENSYALQNVKTVLQNNAYDVVECDLTKTDKIEDVADAITMVIPGPTVDYSQEEIVIIRDWLQQDGEYSRNLVMLTDYSAWCPNLYELVNEEFGIEVSREVIRETKSYFNNPFFAYGDIGDSEFTGELSGKQVLSQYTQRLILH
ncbi:MAG: Gldg family protein, partial [Clostridia bacterium]|nr:Gldg family protein [Clostridia bacterium]